MTIASLPTMMSARDFAWFSARDRSPTGRAQIMYEDYCAGPRNGGVPASTGTTR